VWACLTPFPVALGNCNSYPTVWHACQACAMSLVGMSQQILQPPTSRLALAPCSMLSGTQLSSSMSTSLPPSQLLPCAASTCRLYRTTRSVVPAPGMNHSAHQQHHMRRACWLLTLVGGGYAWGPKA
jgi:hypothetical protein